MRTSIGGCLVIGFMAVTVLEGSLGHAQTIERTPERNRSSNAQGTLETPGFGAPPPGVLPPQYTGLYYFGGYPSFPFGYSLPYAYGNGQATPFFYGGFTPYDLPYGAVSAASSQDVPLKVIPAGRVHLLVDPVDAKVFIDGAQVGQGPDLSFMATLLEGTHTLTITRDGFKLFERNLLVPGGGGLALTVRLEK